MLAHFLDLANVRLHLSVGVRDGVGTENFVTRVLEAEVEAHIIVGLELVRVQFIDLCMIWTYLILDIKATLKPAFSLLAISFSTPKTRLHSVVEK